MVDPVAGLGLVIAQIPEVARQQAQVTGQTALQNGQRPTLIAAYDRLADETVPAIVPASFVRTGNVLNGTPQRENRTYDSRFRKAAVRRVSDGSPQTVESLGTNVDLAA